MRRISVAVGVGLLGLCLCEDVALAGPVVPSGLPPEPAGFQAPHHEADGKPNLPPRTLAGSAAQTPATQSYVVPAVSGNPGEGPDMPHQVKETSAEIWASMIKAPPAGKESFLTKKQAIEAIVASAQAKKISSLPPIAGSNGEILYPYGQSWPTVVGSPLHATVIQLMPGSKPFTVANPSGGLWIITQTQAGDVPEIIVKPLYAGLHNNLVVTATGPQGQSLTYNFTLVSDKSQYVPMVGFYYPDQMLEQWHVAAQGQAAEQQKAQQQTVAVLPNLNVSDLDFGWKIRCGGGGWFSSSRCGSIRPLRVFDDGRQTYIQMPSGLASHGGIPSILARNIDGKPAIINWRYRDGYFIVDGVPTQIDLIAGVGSDAKVVRILKKGAS